jgi:hypothetical protein
MSGDSVIPEFCGLSIGDRLVEFPSDQVGSGVRVAPRKSN